MSCSVEKGIPACTTIFCKVSMGRVSKTIGSFGCQVMDMTSASRCATSSPRPFRKFGNKTLPPSIKKMFGLEWIPIFRMFQDTPGLVLPKAADADFVTESYRLCMNYLKTRVSYVFNLARSNPDNWALSTWCKHVLPSRIESLGTELDKEKLPERSRFNRGAAHTEGLKRKRQLRLHTIVARRQRQNNNNASHTNDSTNDNNGNNTTNCLLYTSPSPRDLSTSRMPSSA